MSIVIPTFDERGNLPSLIERITSAMARTNYTYDIIVIDDHSTDGSREYLQTLDAGVPIHFFAKRGKRGKAYSLLEGIEYASGNFIVMIDADLQYPPEAIPAMLEKLRAHDIVVANRAERHTSVKRSFMSRFGRLFIGKLLNLQVDVQSGLKVFRRDIIKHLTLHPTAWGFDYQFLYKAKRIGCSIGEEDIVFEERSYGKSHVNTLGTGLELAWGALKLRLSYIGRDLFKFLYYPHASEYHRPHKGKPNDFLFLPEIFSIKHHVYSETVSLAIVMLLAITAVIGGLSWITGLSPIIIISSFIAAFYLGLMVFKLWIVHTSTSRGFLKISPTEVASITDAELPIYTILIPLYKEAEVIRQIIKAMGDIDYPPDKLDVIITLEEYDHETINAIKEANPPAHFKTLILPDVKPKTKPKALNVALPQMKGEFFVIYDAEIIPDSDQLKKAYRAFRKFDNIACLQTRLDHYNSNQNWITKLFNAEFSFYYDLFLPGLQKLGFPLPLSGHSTHFRLAAIRDIGGWDPYNVAEDCDVGMRLFRKGYRTEILDSLSQEEATASLSAWIAQRTRWMKGFIQTTIVHLRHPLRLKNDFGGWRNFIAFLTIVPGSVLLNVLNLFYGILLLLWFTTRSPLIQAYFPGPILYVSVISFVMGNFIFTYFNLLGSYKRKRYSIVKYNLLSFVYWYMLAYATIRAMVHLVLKPHHWEKTTHGVHLTSKTPHAGV